MSKYGFISGPYFPTFGKYGPEITPYLDTFHVVIGTTKKKDALYKNLSLAVNCKLFWFIGTNHIKEDKK